MHHHFQQGQGRDFDLLEVVWTENGRGKEEGGVHIANHTHYIQVSHSFVQGLADNSSCCWAWLYLKMASTLDTVAMLLASSNVACAVEESISRSLLPDDLYLSFSVDMLSQHGEFKGLFERLKMAQTNQGEFHMPL